LCVVFYHSELLTNYDPGEYITLVFEWSFIIRGNFKIIKYFQKPVQVASWGDVIEWLHELDTKILFVELRNPCENSYIVGIIGNLGDESLIQGIFDTLEEANID
jgi:hypothetical protein